MTIEKNIATSFSDKTYRNAVVMVKSLLDNYSGENKINLFCFVTENILDKEKDFSNFFDDNRISIKFLVSKKWLEQVDKGNKILANHSWHKLFIASELKDLTDIIYISSDSLFQRDADVFLNYKYSGIISGVIDHFGMGEVIFESQDLIYYWYDNMYANLEQWRALKFEDWVIQYTSNLFINTINKENDALNIFFRKYSRAIPYYFGFPVKMQTESYYNWVLSSPINIVFRGEYRPWTSHQHHPYEIFWRNEYYKIFNEHAPLDKTLKNEVVLND